MAMNKRITKMSSVILALIFIISMFSINSFAEIVPTYSLGCLEEPIDSAKIFRFPDQSELDGLPVSVDLSSNCPPVGNQGSQGSCVGWAVGYAYKTYQEKIEHGWPLNTSANQFSPAYIYNQIVIGNDGGAYLHDAFNLLVNQGCTTLADMPYNQNDYKKQPTSAQKTSASKFKALNWNYLNTGSISDIKNWLASGDTVVAGIRVYTDFDNLSPSNPIQITANGSYRGNHAICIVGYDDSNSTLKIINSWGTSWGVSGYGYIRYDVFKTINNALCVMTDAVDVAPLTPGTYHIKNLNSGKYMDVEGQSKAAGANVLQKNFSGGASQKWKVEITANGMYNIKNINSGMSLDVNDMIDANGTNIKQWYYNGSTAQFWRIISSPDDRGTFRIMPQLSIIRAINVNGASKEDGANIHLWDYGSFTQSPPQGNWVFEKAEPQLTPGTYYIKNLNSGKYMDVEGQSKAAGANVLQKNFSGGASQKWNVEITANGMYNIKNINSGMSLDVNDMIDANGTNIKQWYYNGSTAQFWRIISSPDDCGTFRIMPQLSIIRAINVNGASKEDSANIHLWDYGSFTQSPPQGNWVFEKAEPQLTPGTYYIKNLNSGKYMDVEGQSKTTGANVLQKNFSGGASQKWNVEITANGMYNIKNINSGMSLDVNDMIDANGTNIKQWYYNGSTAQFWRIISSPDDRGTFRIMPQLSIIRAINVNGASKEDSANIHLWDYGSFTQSPPQGNWVFEKAEPQLTPGTYYIKNLNSGKYMDVEGQSKAAGANVLQKNFSGGASQKWNVEITANGMYNIKNINSGMSLDVNDMIDANGTNIKQWYYNGSTAQFWRIISSPENSGAFRIMPQLSIIRAIDVNGVSKEDSANIHLWDYGSFTQSPPQKNWVFEKA